MSFTTLQVTSAYSLLHSTIDLKTYVALGKQLGYEQLALTDEGVMHGAVEFYELCQKEGIRPIIGVQFHYPKWTNAEENAPIVVYAKSEQGYRVLMQLSTLYQDAKTWTPQMTVLVNQASDQVQLVFPQQESEWAEALRSVEQFDSWKKQAIAQWNGVTMALGVEQASALTVPLELVELWLDDGKLTIVPFVRTYYLRAADDYSWKVLRADESNTHVSTTQADVSGVYFLHDPKRMEALFEPYLEGRLLQNLENFTQGLQWTLSLHHRLLPKFVTPKGKTSEAYLRELCVRGLQQKSLDTQEYRERLEYELQIIHQMGFDDYFLIVWDIMRFAHEEGIQTGPGRGSAAGALVAFLLEITQVDPIRYQLLFERFLNPERYTMPDIDLDFPDNQRERLLQYVAEKYRSSHVAQIATFGTFAAKQSIRDVCRVLGVSTVQATSWSRAIPNQLGIKLQEAYEQSRDLRELVAQSPRNQLIFEVAVKIEGLPRHMSTHAAGVVISDAPLVEHVPLVKRDGSLYTTQYTMKYVEQIGLLKMDFLGLTNLTVLHDALQFTKAVYHEEVDILNIPLDDAKTLDLFCRAETNGIFQFESDGIRRVLKKLQPTSIEDLTAVNALYRPGPMEQIDTYVKRRHGKERVSYPHPLLEEILAPTYGVMVYQEQVMQVTSRMAGFTLGEADILRRAIGKKDAATIEQEKHHFVQGAQKQGVARLDAERVYQYIERFANYGFNRSHAFAYSLLAYQLAYLKVHYPIAFFVAIFRSIGDRSSKLQDYLVEAKQTGISIHTPDINTSVGEYTATPDGIYIGLSAIRGIRRDFVYEIVRHRAQYGPYVDFMDFGFRMGTKYCKVEPLEALIDAGAFDGFEQSRATLRATVGTVVESVKFHGANVPMDLSEELYPKYATPQEEDILVTLEREIAVLGFPVSAHPTETYHDLYQQGKITEINRIFESRSVTVIGILKSIRKIRTKKGEPMAFAVIQDYTGEMDVAIFPEAYPVVFQQLKEGNFVLIKGKTTKNRTNQWQIQVQQLEGREGIDAYKEAVQTKCYVRISKENQQESTLQRIRQIVASHPGESDVYLFLEDRKQMIKLNTPRGIRVDAEVVNRFTALLGEGNVKISK